MVFSVKYPWMGISSLFCILPCEVLREWMKGTSTLLYSIFFVCLTCFDNVVVFLS